MNLSYIPNSLLLQYTYKPKCYGKYVFVIYTIKYKMLFICYKMLLAHRMQ